MTSAHEERPDSPGSDGTDESVGISDDQLPEDLVPSEDNPLASGLDDGETVEGLLEDGKRADESDDPDGSGTPEDSDDAGNPEEPEATSDASQGG